jgi:alkaline phosphatase D
MKGRTYRTRRWGKDLQVWFTEGRDFRSPNNMPDGPDKTIWGTKQKQWFVRTVNESDATFKVLISPTPVVGPDRDNKHDNHSNVDFTHEGNELRQFIASQGNMVVVCGDRHWQYMSIHPESGVREYSCGPASDAHAGGWQQSDYREDYHKYLNVTGGFLSGTVERQDGVPTLTFRWHDADGSVNHEDRLTRE